jgi:hypothetical protein
MPTSSARKELEAYSMKNFMVADVPEAEQSRAKKNKSSSDLIFSPLGEQ